MNEPHKTALFKVKLHIRHTSALLSGNVECTMCSVALYEDLPTTRFILAVKIIRETNIAFFCHNYADIAATLSTTVKLHFLGERNATRATRHVNVSITIKHLDWGDKL